MKKIRIIVALISAVMLTSCNMSLGLGSYHFTKVHLVHAHKCVNITSWHDNNTGIEVTMANGNSLFCSEGTYILVEDVCPICGK